MGEIIAGFGGGVAYNNRMINDARYLEMVLAPIRACKTYLPKFGHGAAGYSRAQFQALYRADAFYAWFGLDSPLMYTAHRAAGGMTSIYRQIGIGSQRLVQQVLMDELHLTDTQATWSYTVQPRGRASRTLSLDARIDLADVTERARRVELARWLKRAGKQVGVEAVVQKVLRGCVFEVRQGYKSKDSKRQQADLANASAAYASAYLPVLLLLSTQIDEDIAARYQAARWLLLSGTPNGSAVDSTYSFFREAVGYDLAGFFERHSRTLKTEIEAVLAALLG